VPKIAVVGHVCVDVRVRPTTEFPERGQLVMTDEMSFVVAGMVGNIGRVLGPIGEPAFAVCCVGSDATGDLVAAELATWADTRWVSRSSTVATSGTIVFVLPDGERSFIHAKGSNTEFAASHIPLADLAAAGVRYLHLGYALLLPALDGEPMTAVLREARALGITTSIDMTWDPTGRWMQDIGPLLPHVDIFCPNDVEATALTGCADPTQAALALIEAGVQRLAIVTRGADGVTAAWADGRTRSFPASPAAIVDTTGAGDCFYGGLLAGLAHGLDDDTAIAFGIRSATDAISRSEPSGSLRQ
jgi:sugar/nucleoside kinase (ribokinase family)